ncbi:prolipoprotein diacylglyceryl transferase family protein [Lacipirellula parvula]|uniref:Phosphatidylglycerol--prolipoprotein diacylglyceryl transferase n=1 Tax=Lacipirellula parvula TaxID=2650471 RepID=A0A5K7XIL7_9BACT|nr:prolipoprotein diacylglyceryl transferase family protein [Lacipirellula parvula]BBO36318.1 prolipoprotein diacylglyceryl transferase [Lacipirellula parvula]
MCSELFRIPLKWDNVPIFGAGVLLLLWAVFSVLGLKSTARAMGWPAALKAHLPTIVIVGVALVFFVPKYFPDGVPIRGYGMMVLLGSIAGIWMSVHRAQQAGVAGEEILGLAVWMFISGVIGARLFYVVEYWEDRIRQADVLSTIKTALSFTEGGLVVYGAFIGAMIGFTLYMRRRGLPALAISDMICAGMLVGLAFGRIGCLMNGCCYGGESDVAWAITFPRESGPEMISPPYGDQATSGAFYGFHLRSSSDEMAPAIIDRVNEGSLAATAGLKAGDRVIKIDEKLLAGVAGAEMLVYEAFLQGKPMVLTTSDNATHEIPAIEPPPRSRPVHPAQLYSTITAALLAWVLWSFYPFRRRDGAVTALMITLYPIARFCEESIRVDESAVFGTGMSISQNVSILLLVAAGAMWVWLLRKPAGNLAFPDTAVSS